MMPNFTHKGCGGNVVATGKIRASDCTNAFVHNSVFRCEKCGAEFDGSEVDACKDPCNDCKYKIIAESVQWHSFSDESPKAGTKILFTDKGGHLFLARVDKETEPPTRPTLVSVGSPESEAFFQPEFWMYVPKRPMTVTQMCRQATRKHDAMIKTLEALT